MKKEAKKVAVFLAVVLLATMMVSLTAAAATTTQSIELTTRSVLLIDKSGSMKNQKVVDEAIGNYDLTSYDVVRYFDHRISSDPNLIGGGDSHICETIDEFIDAGFVHITVVTDGEQWPADYSALTGYTDRNLTIHLVEDDKESAEFIEKLEGNLVNSSVKVVKPDGSTEILLDDYKAPIYSIEVPIVQKDTSVDIENEGDKNFIENIKEGYFPWWLILIIAALIAALFDFIHELITRGRDKDGSNSPTGTSTTVGATTVPTPAPIPAKAVVQIAQGAHVLADISGSMAAQHSATAKACMDAQKGSEAVLCFGNSVSEHAVDELHAIQATGQTAGWEALEQAVSKGWDEIVIVSDLGFNCKPFNKNAFSRKFKRVTVVTPRKYDSTTLEEIKKIADEVEVLQL